MKDLAARVARFMCVCSALIVAEHAANATQSGLHSPDPAKRAMAARRIAETGQYESGDIDLLVKMLGDHTQLRPMVVVLGGETTPNEEASKAIVRIGEPSVDKLILTVQSDSSPFGGGYNAAACLGQIGDKRAYPVLLKLLKAGKYGAPNTIGSDDQIPIAVARIGRKEAYEVLLSAYEDAKRLNRMNRGITLALGYSRDERFFPILKQMVESDKRDVRLDAIPALGHLRSSKAIPVLTELLASKDLHARWYSCEALSEIGDRTAVPYIKTLRETEKSSVVIDAANKAIRELETPVR
jgi:HEAT repeat protein